MDKTNLETGKAKSSRGVVARRRILAAVAILMLLVLCWMQLDISAQWGNWWFYFLTYMPIKYMALSVMTIGMVFFLLYAIIGNLAISGLVLSLLSTLIAVANYYIIEFHNSPLSFLEARNLRTAIDVAGAYSLTLTPRVLLMLGICLLELILVFAVLWRLQKQKVFGQRSLRRSIVLIGCSVLLLLIGYAGPIHMKPDRVIVWNWTTCYPYYGYVVCTAETLQTCFNLVEKPQGYSAEAVASVDRPDQLEAGMQADIILILNETLSDPAQYCEISADTDYFAGIRSLENSVQGYAVVPQIGGGTNKTEYEYLTSNSMSMLMQSGSPFLSQDMEEVSSVVKMLNEQGYETTGIHSRNGVNYSRDIAYPQTGFQNIHFRSDFADLAYPRGRPAESDASVYDNLIRWYEESRTRNRATGNDKPQFFYCLTYQNHGGWDSSPDESDTVHLSSDLGSNTSKMNEYLSLMKDSDDAFVGLTEYFAQADRPVIVCMLGDHAPSFAEEVADDDAYDADELDLRLRATPFVIWANFDIEDADLGYVSSLYLAPYTLRLAGAAQSSYSAYVLSMMERFPVVAAYGVYYDAEGRRLSYEDELDPTLRDYFYLEYANITGAGDDSWYHLEE